MRKCDCTEWIRIIKTLYQKKMTRLAEGKKVTTGDEKYLRQAEENLYGELAVALGINRDEVKDYIINRVEG
jgi:CarD family transcriptional regulator